MFRVEVGLDFFGGEFLRKQTFELRWVDARSLVGVTDILAWAAGITLLAFFAGACRLAVEEDDCGSCLGRSAKETRCDLIYTAELRWCLSEQGVPERSEV